MCSCPVFNKENNTSCLLFNKPFAAWTVMIGIVDIGRNIVCLKDIGETSTLKVYRQSQDQESGKETYNLV